MNDDKSQRQFNSGVTTVIVVGFKVLIKGRPECYIPCS